MQSHIRKVYACLAVNAAQNDRGLLSANTGVKRIPKQKSAQKVYSGEENSPAAPAGIRTCDLSITSPAL